MVPPVAATGGTAFRSIYQEVKMSEKLYAVGMVLTNSCEEHGAEVKYIMCPDVFPAETAEAAILMANAMNPFGPAEPGLYVAVPVSVQGEDEWMSPTIYRVGIKVDIESTYKTNALNLMGSDEG